MLTQTDLIVVSTEPKTAKQTLASRAVTIGREHHMPYLVLPKLGVINEPVYFNNWLCVPREMDTSFVPPRADEQIEHLTEDGILVKQQIIMHEPKKDKPVLVLPGVDHAKVMQAGKTLVKVVTVTAGAVAVAGFAVAYLAAMAIAYDPALCVVLSDETGTEDGLWIVVATWKD